MSNDQAQHRLTVDRDGNWVWQKVCISRNPRRGTIADMPKLRPGYKLTVSTETK